MSEEESIADDENVNKDEKGDSAEGIENKDDQDSAKANSQNDTEERKAAEEKVDESVTKGDKNVNQPQDGKMHVDDSGQSAQQGARTQYDSYSVEQKEAQRILNKVKGRKVIKYRRRGAQKPPSKDW